MQSQAVKSMPIGCIDTRDSADHQLQFWIEPNGDRSAFRFVIRNQYKPGGRLAKRCDLNSGSFSSSYDDVAAAGRKAFEQAFTS